MQFKRILFFLSVIFILSLLTALFVNVASAGYPRDDAAYREIQCQTTGACGGGHYYSEYDCNFKKFPIEGVCPAEGGVRTCWHSGKGEYTSYWPWYIFGYGYPTGDVRTPAMITSGACELGSTTGDKGNPCSTPSVSIGSSANLKSGNLYHSQTIGIFKFSYNSTDFYNGSLGKKWFNNFESKIWVSGSNILLKAADGNIIYFRKLDSIFYPEERSGDTSHIISNSDGTYTRITNKGDRYNYSSN